MPQLDDNAGLLTSYLATQRYRAARPHLRGRVLDVGCANGSLTEWCRPDAYVGIDIDAASIAIARIRHPEYRFQHDLPADETFDTVVALALIEHVDDPGAFIEQLRGC